MTIESHGVQEFYPIGTVCEKSHEDDDNECGTSRDLNNCYAHDGSKNGDFYRVVQGGPGCPYLEETRCPDDVDALLPCEDNCLEEGQTCVGGGVTPDLCGAREGECYKVTSTKFMPRDGCDGTGGSSKKKSSNDKAGLIAGVAIACVAAVLIMAAVTYCCCRPMRLALSGK